MYISKYTLGQLQTNCYILAKNEECLIIDPSDDAVFILEQIQRMKLKPVGMFATHGHFDHLMAVGEIQTALAGESLTLYIHESDLFLLKRLKETAKHFLGYDPYILQPTDIKFMKEGKMKIGGFNFEVIKTPGHTPGSCCYFFAKEKVIFTGDTLFKGTVGRYDFSYSSYSGLKKSLKELFNLPEETFVYSGHGEETTISLEKLHQHH